MQARVAVERITSRSPTWLPKFDSTLGVSFQLGQRTVTSHFVMVIQQIRLPKFGEYTIDLAVDGRQLGSIPLYVTQVERPA